MCSNFSYTATYDVSNIEDPRLIVTVQPCGCNIIPCAGSVIGLYGDFEEISSSAMVEDAQFRGSIVARGERCMRLFNVIVP